MAKTNGGGTKALTGAAKSAVFNPTNIKSTMLKNEFPKKNGIGKSAGEMGKVGKMKALTKDEARSKAVDKQMKKNVEGLPKSNKKLPFS